jgi:hypothetical protein
MRVAPKTGSPARPPERRAGESHSEPYGAVTPQVPALPVPGVPE